MCKNLIFDHMKIFSSYSLKNLNTFHINTDSKYFAEVASLSELIDAKRFAEEKKLRTQLIGGGSNILFTQRNFDGLIIHNRIMGFDTEDLDENYMLVTAGAGEKWDDLVNFCVVNGWGGIENLSYIPGTAGAAPIQNIGAYGAELQDIFHKLTAYDTVQNVCREFSPAECTFGYRDSVFKKMTGRYYIISITLRLRKKPVYNIDYGAVGEEISKNGESVNLSSIRNAIIKIRKRKLPDPDAIGNGGSFYKNPVIHHKLFSEVQSKHPAIPYYQSGTEKYKIPAAWLIEQAGWKGYRKGDAGVHQNHALVLVNYGNASGNEVYELSEEIKESVFIKFGINLETEVNILK